VIVAADARGGRAVMLSKVDKANRANIPVSRNTACTRNRRVRQTKVPLLTLGKGDSIGEEEPRQLTDGPVLVQVQEAALTLES
jgi:hypothetical protein